VGGWAVTYDEAPMARPAHNSSRFGAGAQTADPGPGSTLAPPRTRSSGMG
jgi:hypothetical protein